VKLINVDGLTLFGPGSEWFWSMLQLIVVAISLIGLYRQLRLQSSAGAIEQATALASDWNSELLHRSRLATLLLLRDGVDQGVSSSQAAIEIGNYWERVGWLVRSGHIDRRIVYAYVGNSVRLWWKLLAPNAQELRNVQRDPQVFEHFEWLANAIETMDQQTGVMINYDDKAYVAQLIESGVERSRSAIQLAEQLRAVSVHPLSATTPAPRPKNQSRLGGSSTHPRA